MDYSMCSVLCVQNIYYINDVGLWGGGVDKWQIGVVCHTVASLPA